MEESPVERYFRDAREATIPEGTSQIQILHLGKALSATRRCADPARGARAGPVSCPRPAISLY
jgi:hypothetical protein